MSVRCALPDPNTLKTQAHRRRPWRALARALARTLAALLVLLAALVLALWVWAGTPGSLASSLRLAARLLPAGQALQIGQVSGTLRAGGQVDALHWSGPQLAVQVQNLRVAWSWPALLHGRVELGELHARRITLKPLGTPEAAPAEPAQNLALPLPIHLPFSADEIVWTAPDEAPLAITKLRGDYAWDGGTHHLRIDNIALAQGRYQAQASLAGTAPMRLAASVQGQVQAEVPGGDAPIEARVQAAAEGTLAGADARLAISADLKGGGDGPESHPPRAPISAELTAQLAPWATQPLVQARARLRSLDLAALWPQAPSTRLSGTASLQPQELPAPAGWALEANLTNETPGPWNEHHLPLSALQAHASYSSAPGGAHWQVPEARLHIGPGVLTVSDAEYDAATQALRARLTLRELNPAQLHAGLPATPVSGSAELAGSLAQGLRVRATLSGAHATRPDELALEHLRLDGEWKAGTAHIDRLSLAALQASIEARDFTLTPAERAAGGTLTARVPGATLQFKGHLAPRSGQGQIDLAMQDAAALQHWLAALPRVALPAPGAQAPALLQTQATGSAQLQAHWQGGWLAALAAIEGGASTQPATPPSTPSAIAPFKLQANLSVPGLTLQAPGGAPLALSEVQASVDGTLAQLSLSLNGSIRHGTGATLLSARTQWRASAALQKPGSWQAQIAKLTLEARAGTHPGPWRMQLQAPLTLALHGGAQPQLQTGVWQVQIDGPEPGTATLHAEPLTLAWPETSPRLFTQGRIDGVPLAWANALGSGEPALLARLGLSGDVLLGARWRIELAEALHAQVDIERTRGDLHLRIDGQDTPAGVGEAALHLRADGSQLELNALWRSTHAGEASLMARVPLAPGDQGWGPTKEAPLSGTLHAALPDVGAWARLAPPGWRVHGSLAADATLSGQLSAPRLAGRISADGLALRSVLDGVDLQDGRLRAQLDGDHLSITELTLKGGSGSGARIAGPGGNLTPAPGDGGTLSASGGITWKDNRAHLDIQAQAKALQVLARADRQLSVSGGLHARLLGGQLQLTGELTADRASILLPDDSAPALGADVVVHAGTDKAAPVNTPEKQPQPAQAPRIDVKLDLGEDFAVQGHGLSTRLKGQLHIVNDASGHAGAMPRVLGEIRTVQGRYRAWGQVLDVENGLLRFSGPMDNPQLDILALRPRISERVGVQVSGSAQAPRVRLYSEPDMPDAEKLSWLVLGRSATAGGADAALMQQAALALLGGGRDPGSTVARRLGLDEIGFRGADASNPASGAALTLGKRLSRDLYVSYEHSLAGAMGTLYVFLDLSRHLTLRGQTGTQSGLDLIYTLRYD